MSDLYDATVPVFTTFLGGIDGWLDEAVALAAARKFDVQILLDARLAPDQYDFKRQVQSACDYAKFGPAKLTGKEAPLDPDTERTVDELRGRVRKISAFVASFRREDFAGAEERRCSHSWMDGKALRGVEYAHRVALPNFHFHLSHAYAILRHNGVALGKMDYLGALPYAG